MTSRNPSECEGQRSDSRAFYDQGEVFDRYQQHRAWHLNPNVTLEEPAFFAELGSVRSARVLDLGCGDATTGQTLLAAGCASYLGIDDSERMVQAAEQNLAGGIGHVVLGDVTRLKARPDSFDLIVARMVLHNLENVGPLLHRCYESLSDGGRIVVTVTHPVITSHDRRASTNERRQDWVVDDYFLEGARQQIWMGAPSVWYHRTIETYVRELRAAGFVLTNLRECPPVSERFDDSDEFERRRRIPLMLLLAGARP